MDDQKSTTGFPASNTLRLYRALLHHHSLIKRIKKLANAVKSSSDVDI